jgi:thiamine-phosphate pyrophosphorylase
MPRVLLYYITDRAAFSGDEFARRHTLLAKIAEAARAGVDYIQLREKDLPARDLESLTRAALSAIRDVQVTIQNVKPRTENQEPRTENQEPRTALLINSRSDVALATAADGVHLPANSISPAEVRRIWDSSSRHAASPYAPGTVISVSCHEPIEVRAAETGGADFAVFAPVFEKKSAPGARPAGLDALRRACRHRIPVFALGGVTLENAAACLEAGASGIAGIRLFQDHDIAEVVRRLRG